MAFVRDSNTTTSELKLETIEVSIVGLIVLKEYPLALSEIERYLLIAKDQQVLVEGQLYLFRAIIKIYQCDFEEKNDGTIFNDIRKAKQTFLKAGLNPKGHMGFLSMQVMDKIFSHIELECVYGTSAIDHLTSAKHFIKKLNFAVKLCKDISQRIPEDNKETLMPLWAALLCIQLESGVMEAKSTYIEIEKYFKESDQNEFMENLAIRLTNAGNEYINKLIPKFPVVFELKSFSLWQKIADKKVGKGKFSVSKYTAECFESLQINKTQEKKPQSELQTATISSKDTVENKSKSTFNIDSIGNSINLLIKEKNFNMALKKIELCLKNINFFSKNEQMKAEAHLYIYRALIIMHQCDFDEKEYKTILNNVIKANQKFPNTNLNNPETSPPHGSGYFSTLISNNIFINAENLYIRNLSEINDVKDINHFIKKLNFMIKLGKDINQRISEYNLMLLVGAWLGLFNIYLDLDNEMEATITYNQAVTFSKDIFLATLVMRFSNKNYKYLIKIAPNLIDLAGEYRFLKILLEMKKKCSNQDKVLKVSSTKVPKVVTRQIEFPSELNKIIEGIEAIVNGKIAKGIKLFESISEKDYKKCGLNARDVKNLFGAILNEKLTDLTNLFVKKDFSKIEKTIALCQMIKEFRTEDIYRAKALAAEAVILDHENKIEQALTLIDESLTLDPKNVDFIKLRIDYQLKLQKSDTTKNIQTLLNQTSKSKMDKDEKQKAKVIKIPEPTSPPKSKIINIRPELQGAEENIILISDTIDSNDFDNLISGIPFLMPFLDIDKSFENISDLENQFIQERIKKFAMKQIDKINNKLCFMIQDQNMENSVKKLYCEKLLEIKHISSATLGEAYYQYAKIYENDDKQGAIDICEKSLARSISEKTRSKITALKTKLQTQLKEQTINQAAKEARAEIVKDIGAINDIKKKLLLLDQQFRQSFAILKQDPTIRLENLEKEYQKYHIEMTTIKSAIATFEIQTDEQKNSEIAPLPKVQQTIYERKKLFDTLKVQFQNTSKFFNKTFEDIKTNINKIPQKFINRMKAESKSISASFSQISDAIDALLKMEKKEEIDFTQLNHHQSTLAAELISIEMALKEQRIQQELLKTYNLTEYNIWKEMIISNEKLFQELSRKSQHITKRLQQVALKSISENQMIFNEINVIHAQLNTIINKIRQPDYNEYKQAITAQKKVAILNPQLAHIHIEENKKSFDLACKNFQKDIEKIQFDLKQIDDLTVKIKENLFDENQRQQYDKLIFDKQSAEQQLLILKDAKGQDAFNEAYRRIKKMTKDTEEKINLLIDNINKIEQEVITNSNALSLRSQDNSLLNAKDIEKLKAQIEKTEERMETLKKQFPALHPYQITTKYATEQKIMKTLVEAQKSLNQAKEKLKKAEKILGYQTALKDAKLDGNLQVLIDLAAKYPNIVFKGGFASYAGLLAILGVKIANKLTINDFDATILDDDPLNLAKQLEEQEGFIASPPALDNNGQLKYISLRKELPDGKWVDMNVRPKNYKGDTFITSFNSLKLYILPENKADPQKYVVIPITNHLCLCIEKNQNYFDFCNTVKNKIYSVARYQPEIHERYYVTVVKNYKKLKDELFENELNIDDKHCHKGLESYQALLNELDNIFKTELNSPDYQRYVNCFLEINALIKKFGITDKDVQPYLKALIKAMIEKAYPKKHTDSALNTLSTNIIQLIHVHYKDNPYLHDPKIENSKQDPKNINSQAMHSKFDSIIFDYISSHIKDSPAQDLKYEEQVNLREFKKGGKQPITSRMLPKAPIRMEPIYSLYTLDQKGLVRHLTPTEMMFYRDELYFYDSSRNTYYLVKKKGEALTIDQTNPAVYDQLYALRPLNTPVDISTEMLVTPLLVNFGLHQQQQQYQQTHYHTGSSENRKNFGSNH